MELRSSEQYRSLCGFYATTARGGVKCPVEPASPTPPILSPQVTASEAMVMLDVPDIADTELLAIADTLVSLRAPPTQSQPPPRATPSPAPNSASYPRSERSSYLPSLALQHVIACNKQ